MKLSRRDLSAFLPALLVASAEGETPVLPSKTYPWEDMAVKKNAENGMEARNVFKGPNRNGCVTGLHISSLPPGKSPHLPHRHAHEEMMLVREGMLDCMVSGKTSRIGPGGVFYVASNEEHGIKNVGSVTAQYFVVEFGA